MLPTGTREPATIQPEIPSEFRERMHDRRCIVKHGTAAGPLDGPGRSRPDVPGNGAERNRTHSPCRYPVEPTLAIVMGRRDQAFSSSLSQRLSVPADHDVPLQPPRADSASVITRSPGFQMIAGQQKLAHTEGSHLLTHSTNTKTLYAAAPTCCLKSRSHLLFHSGLNL